MERERRGCGTSRIHRAGHRKVSENEIGRPRLESGETFDAIACGNGRILQREVPRANLGWRDRHRHTRITLEMVMQIRRSKPLVSQFWRQCLLRVAARPSPAVDRRKTARDLNETRCATFTPLGGDVAVGVCHCGGIPGLDRGLDAHLVGIDRMPSCQQFDRAAGRNARCAFSSRLTRISSASAGSTFVGQSSSTCITMRRVRKRSADSRGRRERGPPAASVRDAASSGLNRAIDKRCRSPAEPRGFFRDRGDVVERFAVGCLAAAERFRPESNRRQRGRQIMRDRAKQ